MLLSRLHLSVMTAHYNITNWPCKATAISVNQQAVDHAKIHVRMPCCIRSMNISSYNCGSYHFDACLEFFKRYKMVILSWHFIDVWLPCSVRRTERKNNEQSRLTLTYWRFCNSSKLTLMIPRTSSSKQKLLRE
jgi:hypothetical protein